MLRHFFVLCLAAVFIVVDQSLEAATLTGSVLNADGGGLQYAVVSVIQLGLNQTTDASGGYRFENVGPGKYVLQVRLLGYAAQTRILEVASASDTIRLDIVMKESPFQSSAVVVSAETDPSTTTESPIASSVLDDRRLEIQRDQSIAGTISLLPGVREFSGGPINSKPVIRGLSSQRVVVARDGIMIGSQTWDEPQAPEASVFDLAKIEVVRGPNSVMFGSDAIGGVVNIVTTDVFVNPDGQLHGILDLNAISNTLGGAGAVTVSQADLSTGFKINLGGRYAGSYTAPGGILPSGMQLESGEVSNSGATEFSGTLAGGIRGDWGTATLNISQFSQRNEIHPEPGRKEIEIDPITGQPDTVDASPVQEIGHSRASLSVLLPMNKTLLELTAGFQYNSRKEEGVNKEEEEEDEEKGGEVLLDLYTTTIGAKATITDVATVGVSLLHQRNQTLGLKAIIPYYSQLNVGGYAYREQSITDNFRAMAGLRFDYRTLDALANQELTSPDTSLYYNALSGNFGMSWMIKDGFSIGANAGTGWRSPVAAELFGRGKDEGVARYKVGRSDLRPERSLNVEVGMHINQPGVRAELSIYQNTITDFIGLAPSGAVIEGLPVYEYFQTDASIGGVEASFEMSVTDWLVAGVGADVLRGTDKMSDSALPLMPADRGWLLLSYRNNSMSWIKDFNLSLRPRYVLEQNRVASGEAITPAYFVLDASVGGIVSFGTTPVHADLIMQNLTNTAYVDHLSRYKAFAFNPGLNVMLKVSVPIF